MCGARRQDSHQCELLSRYRMMIATDYPLTTVVVFIHYSEEELWVPPFVVIQCGHVLQSS